MILINASNITKSYGVNIILDNVSFKIEEGDKIGILGVNGAGKTTLFKILTGEIKEFSGEAYKNNQLSISYMEQHCEYSSNINAIDEAISVFSNLHKMEEELSAINTLLEKNADESSIKKQHQLQEEFINKGGLTYKSRTMSTLLGLGFTKEELELPINSLSGGQRTRVMLAKILLKESDILLLDEPTNHLDLNSIAWLEDFLKNYKGTVMLISHDRFFLDKVTNKIFEIENTHLTEYNGNYSYYLNKKEADREALAKDYEKKMSEIKRLEGIITQQKQWNREKNIKTAESKQKVIDRIEKTVERPNRAPEKIKFNFRIDSSCGNDVLIAEGISKSFSDTKTFLKKKLFENVDIFIQKKEKVFLLGSNGCGKTTLFNIILGNISDHDGSLDLGARVKLGYYDQTQSDLSIEKTIFEEISDSLPKLDNTTIRNALAAFLFKGDDVFKKISTLSGGEKARVSLTKLMLSSANFLLLDEPTNHLDIQSKEALEGALLDYDGTLFIISHDRYFINKLADKIYELTPNSAKLYGGNYNYYLEKRKYYEDVKVQVKPKNNDYKIQKLAEAEKRKLHTKRKRVEEEIEEYEKSISKLNKKVHDPNISTDYEKILKLTDEINIKEEYLHKLYEQWEKCESELALS